MTRQTPQLSHSEQSQRFCYVVSSDVNGRLTDANPRSSGNDPLWGYRTQVPVPHEPAQECSHPNGFSRTERYRLEVKSGQRTETWREVCPDCKAWIGMRRVNGEES